MLNARLAPEFTARIQATPAAMIRKMAREDIQLLFKGDRASGSWHVPQVPVCGAEHLQRSAPA